MVVNHVIFDGRRAPSTDWLGCRVHIVVDRPLGQPHPRLGFIYAVNYGFLDGVSSDDGSELDAYIVGIDHPIVAITGWCVGVIHREDDMEDKLVVSTERRVHSAFEIAAALDHHECFFRYRILVASFKDIDCVFSEERISN